MDFGVAPFRFENMWTFYPTFLDCIGRWWSECEVGGGQSVRCWGLKFMKKLQYMKRILSD